MQTNACAALIAVAELEAEHLQASMQEWTQAVGFDPAEMYLCHMTVYSVDCSQGRK